MTEADATDGSWVLYGGLLYERKEKKGSLILSFSLSFNFLLVEVEIHCTLTGLVTLHLRLLPSAQLPEI